MTFEEYTRHIDWSLTVGRRRTRQTARQAASTMRELGPQGIRVRRGRSAAARHPNEPGHVPGRGDGQGGRRAEAIAEPAAGGRRDRRRERHGPCTCWFRPAFASPWIALLRVPVTARWAHRPCPRSAPRQLRWSAWESVGCGSRRRSPTAGSWLRMMAPLISTGGRRAVSARPPGCGRLRLVSRPSVSLAGPFGEGASWEV